MSETYGTIEVVSWVQSSWIGTCCNVASACLVFYDYLFTLGREIDFMWGRRLSSVTLLFHLNRWTTLIWAIVLLLASNLSNPEYEPLLLQSLSTCTGLGILGYTLDLALDCFWAAFSGIRMYAVSGGSWSLTFITSLLSMVSVGMNAYYGFGTTTYAIGGIPGIGQWCIAYSSMTEDTYTKFTIATCLCAIAADVLILVVTWCKTYATKREADQYGIETPLTTMLLRDGTVYFILLLCSNVLSMAGIATNVFTFASAFTTPFSSIIISHFLLNLRQLAYGPHNDELNSRPSFILSQHGSPNGSRPASLRFASFVDNMGGDLDHGFGDADRSLDWHVSEGDVNAVVGSISPAEAEAVRDFASASGPHGTGSDAEDVEMAIVKVTNHPIMQEELEQNATKGKTTPHLQFVTTHIAHPNLVPTASEPQLEDANVDIAAGVEMHKYKPQGVDDV